MIQLKNVQVTKETEKALLLNFTGFTNLKTKAHDEYSQDFPEAFDLWFPKSKIKMDNDKYLVKDTNNFWMNKEIDIAVKMGELKLKKEKEEGILLNGKIFKVKRFNSTIEFIGDITFTVGFKAKSPEGYYEQHRQCKGERSFGYVFFIKGIEGQYCNDLLSYLDSNFYDGGYSNKYMLNVGEGWKSIWFNEFDN
jgi:cell shape-determining protein MreC